MHVGIANPRMRGKRSRHSRRMRNPQFYVSGRRLVVIISRLPNASEITLKAMDKTNRYLITTKYIKARTICIVCAFYWLISLLESVWYNRHDKTAFYSYITCNGSVSRLRQLTGLLQRQNGSACCYYSQHLGVCLVVYLGTMLFYNIVQIVGIEIPLICCPIYTHVVCARGNLGNTF